jgi:hypothetical protein
MKGHNLFGFEALRSNRTDPVETGSERQMTFRPECRLITSLKRFFRLTGMSKNNFSCRKGEYLLAFYRT